MHEPEIDRLCRRLQQAGVAPGHVARLATELSDHFDDLETEAIRNGLSRGDAKAEAINKLGDLDTIAEHVLSHPGLKSWPHRFPRLARIILPIAYCLALPAVPIYAGLAHSSSVGRWFACLIISGMITSGMLFVMQIAITAA